MRKSVARGRKRGPDRPAAAASRRGPAAPDAALPAGDDALRYLISASHERAYLLDTRGVVLAVNETAARSVGRTVNDVVGRDLFDLFSPDVGAVRRPLFRKVVLSARPLKVNGQRDGRMLLTHLQPLCDDGGKTTHVAIFAFDVTDQNYREEERALHLQQVRRLAVELALAEERQRRRIAAELHDDVAQALMLAKMRLDILRRDDPGGRTAKLVAGPADLVERAIRGVWATIFDLSPPALYGLGLAEALKLLVDRYQQQHVAVRFTFRDDGQPKPLADDVQATLYPAVRELLLNVVKHARARRVKVTCCSDGKCVTVEVADDGRGFDPAAVPASRKSRIGGFGLRSTRERMECLGGHVHVRSSPGRGTRAVLVAPLGRKRGARARKAK